MIVDGKAIAEELRKSLADDIRALGRAPRLDIVMAGAHPASVAYVGRKKVFGEKIGATVAVHALDPAAGRDTCIRRVSDIASNPATHGVLVQLPLPEEIRGATRAILDAIPPEKDVDALSSAAIGQFLAGSAFVPPTMVRVVEHILARHKIELRGKRIVLVGAGGDLVGKPIAAWLLVQDLPFSAITKQTSESDMRAILRGADVIISGVGKAGLITADKVKDGVVAIDAGMSGASGALAGDMDKAIAEKAKLFTPVPGGVGPVTVAMLFRNLLDLAKNKGEAKKYEYIV